MQDKLVNQDDQIIVDGAVLAGSIVAGAPLAPVPQPYCCLEHSHLYGVLRLPDREPLPCATFVMDVPDTPRWLLHSD